MPTFNQLMETQIDEIGLSTRTQNCLRRADINTIRDVLLAGYRRLKVVRTLSEKSLEEVVTIVCEYCQRNGYDARAVFAWSGDDDEMPKRDDYDTRRYF